MNKSKDVGRRFKLKSIKQISDFLHGSTGKILSVEQCKYTGKIDYTVMLDVPKSNHISKLSKMHIERWHFDFIDTYEIF